MDEFNLSPEEVSNLRREHKKCKRSKDGYRINTIILLGTGWSVTAVSEALLLDEGTIRNHLRRYVEGGLKSLLQNHYKGSISKLSDIQIKKLDKHIDENIYYDSKDIIKYIQDEFGVIYSESGMRTLLHRMGYVHKKTKLVPGKADIEAQINFIEEYDNIKATKGENDPLYFMDGTHPHHNAMQGYGWIKKGTDKEIKSNTGRKRLNINGAIDPATQSMVFRFDDTINAQSTVKLLKAIERKHKNAISIYVVCDNAPYYRSKLVKKYLEQSKIQLMFLPAYSPNLNLIERLWKLFHEKVLYNKYYSEFSEYKFACHTFFKKIRKYKKEIKSRLTDNFQLIAA